MKSGLAVGLNQGNVQYSWTGWFGGWKVFVKVGCVSMFEMEILEVSR